MIVNPIEKLIRFEIFETSFCLVKNVKNKDWLNQIKADFNSKGLDAEFIYSNLPDLLLKN